jgi:hypothetical protein
VLKTVVPLGSIRRVEIGLGYEFYHIEPATGRVREVDEIFGPEAERDFWIKLDDLGTICAPARGFAATGKPAGAASGTQSPGAVYLAETTSDLKDSRDTIKRDLEQHGYTVLPNNPLPVAAGDVDAKCARRSRATVSRFTSSAEPQSFRRREVVAHRDAERAGDCAERGRRLLAARVDSARPRVDDDRQKKCSTTCGWIRAPSAPPTSSDAAPGSADAHHRVAEALVRRHRRRAPRRRRIDAASGLSHLRPARHRADVVWSDFLFKQGCEVLRPIFDGDETDIREYSRGEPARLTAS